MVRVSRPKPYFVNTYCRLVPQVRSLLETRCESVARREAQAPEFRQSGGGELESRRGWPRVWGRGEWVNEEAGKQRRAVKSF